MRLYVVEGLGGKGNSINQFYLANERTKPNDLKFKMLYNPQIRFKNRKYADFNCSFKFIKLRDSLSSTIGAPDIYLRDKVAEDVYSTLITFGEIRKLDRANLVTNFNLFPEVSNILVMERKYGDAVLYEDINGIKKKRRKRVN